MSMKKAEAWCRDIARTKGNVLILTGAGLSAESGIPTFRGEEGYWRVGSRNYQPMELAQSTAFMANPYMVWAWYLYRRAVCLAAQPNPAHDALVRLESAIGDRFRHVTQNVDGLHFRAGSSHQRTFPIHGDINKMRCSDPDCTHQVWDIPETISTSWEKGQELSQNDRETLVCSVCGKLTRPHILWFDECYDEEWYQATSAVQAAHDANLLIIIGTSGATSLPHKIFYRAVDRIPIIVIDNEPTVFSQNAEKTTQGVFVSGSASEVFPSLVQYLVG